MLAKNVLPNDAFRTLAACAGASVIGTLWERETKERKLYDEDSYQNESSQSQRQRLQISDFRFPIASIFSHLEPNRSLTEHNSQTFARQHLNLGSEQVDKATQKKKTLNYDFVIVGNGIAGHSAAKVLRATCPDASIAVVDPLRVHGSKESDTNSHQSNLDYHSDYVSGFNPHDRTVQFLSDPSMQLRYRCGVLVASGARGAPPPLELFDPAALPLLLELRSTELVGNNKRPVMLPNQVRQKVLNTAASGNKVAILGSGWEAVDLANVAAQQAKKQRGTRSKSSTTIVFGNPGPVWNILPQYLSSELRKRMRKQGIDIQDRSIGMLRFLACDCCVSVCCVSG